MNISNLELDPPNLWFGENDSSEKKKALDLLLGKNTSRTFHMQLLGVHGLARSACSKDRGCVFGIIFYIGCKGQWEVGRK